MGFLSDRHGRSLSLMSGMWPYDADISGNGPSVPRIRAISVVLAAQASSFSDVADFRRRYLGDTLKPADQIDAWLGTLPETRRETVAYWLCNIPLEHLKTVSDGDFIIPKKIMEEAWRNLRDDNERPSARTRTLYYATPQRERMGEKVRATGGVLDTLRTIARDLVAFYTPVAPAGMNVKSLWREEHAVTFILTGYAPLVPEQSFRLPSRPGRRQTEKALELAAFVALHEAEGMSPTQQFDAWNSRFSAWAYKDLPHFSFDGREARRRLFDVEGGTPKFEEREHSAEDVAIAIEEMHRQQREQGESESAQWAVETPKYLEDAKRRGETEDTEQARFESMADLVLSIRHWQERGEKERVRQLCEMLVDRCMPEFQRRTYGLRHRPELREDAIAAMIERLTLEARNPNEVFMTKNFAHYLRTLCAVLLNQVLQQEGLSYGREIADSSDTLQERMDALQAEQILLNLPDPLDRQIMVLRVLEGLQWEEIAQICGKTERAVRQRFQKARADLAAHLSGKSEQAPDSEESTAGRRLLEQSQAD